MSPLIIVQWAIDDGGYPPIMNNVSRHIQRSSSGLRGDRNWESSTVMFDPELRAKPCQLMERLNSSGGDPYILRRASCYLAGSLPNQPGLSTRMFDPRV